MSDHIDMGFTPEDQPPPEAEEVHIQSEPEGSMMRDPQHSEDLGTEGFEDFKDRESNLQYERQRTLTLREKESIGSLKANETVPA